MQSDETLVVVVMWWILWSLLFVWLSFLPDFQSRKGLSITSPMCNSAAELVAHVGCVRLHRPKIFPLSKKKLVAHVVRHAPDYSRICKSSVYSFQTGQQFVVTTPLTLMVFGTVITRDQCTWRSAFSLYWLLREMSSLKSPLGFWKDFEDTPSNQCHVRNCCISSSTKACLSMISAWRHGAMDLESRL